MLRTLLIVLYSAIAGPAAAIGDDADRALLVAAVSEIAAPGVPGPLVVVGNHAFAVVSAKCGRFEAPVVAAAEYGKGRIVAFGHTGYADAPDDGQTRTLIRNAIAWAGRRKAGEIDGLSIVAIDASWAKGLRDMGLRVQDAGKKSIPDFADARVLMLSQSPRSDAEIEALRKFVRDGGGVLAAGLGWGWLQLNPQKSLEEHPLNRAFGEMGILWADHTLDRSSKIGFKVRESLSPMLNAATALDQMLGGKRSGPNPDREMLQAGETLTRAVRTLPRADLSLRPKLKELLASKDDELKPTEKSPLTSADGLRRTLLALQLAELSSASPDEIRAHPAAEEFPGKVDPGAQAVSREFDLDPRTPDWRSVGLYAAPGNAIEVEIPREAAAQGYRVRIGAHRDELWDKDKWSRVPEITSEWPLNNARTRVASAFGGPVYLVIPDKKLGARLHMRISGAFEMPHYVHGVTELDAWRSHIRKAPAPWAELETTKVILTIPSRVIRELENPDELMRFWDDLCDAHATLAAIPLERKRPERFVADVQISAGYMHSGYPIMTHLDVAELFVDVARLRAGKAWGFFHELGHNHQEGDWTFDGTGEVTCNLFALHAIDTICKPESGDRGHPGVNDPPSHAKYAADGAKFEKWKSDPFLALQMYIQLQREFGWVSFKKVFAEYRTLKKEERPKTDAEKRDQWMTRFSRSVGRDLGPFFEAWGVPTSESARKSIADLPAWMPTELKPAAAP